jgi:hypothetical protein
MALENEILTLMNNLYRNMRAQPLSLGGISGLNGGTGGPPGGFVGWLPQSRITYDTTEGISASGVLASGVGNLVDNLNHIRYRFPIIISGAISTPPTDSELDSIFGTPSTAGANFMRIVDKDGAHTDLYTVLSDGTNWWYNTLTKAT